MKPYRLPHLQVVLQGFLSRGKAGTAQRRAAEARLSLAADIDSDGYRRRRDHPGLSLNLCSSTPRGDHQPVRITGLPNVAATFDFRVSARAASALTGCGPYLPIRLRRPPRGDSSDQHCADRGRGIHQAAVAPRCRHIHASASARRRHRFPASPHGEGMQAETKPFGVALRPSPITRGRRGSGEGPCICPPFRTPPGLIPTRCSVRAPGPFRKHQ